jgi:ATP-dependent RNA helicase RhlE
MSFSQMGLIDPLLKALREEGYEKPTPIQVQSIAPVLEGRDLFGAAQTGTGKTAAFSLPILQRLSEEQVKGQRQVRCLILAPTRELAIQIHMNATALNTFSKFSIDLLIGGHDRRNQNNSSNEKTGTLNSGITNIFPPTLSPKQLDLMSRLTRRFKKKYQKDLVISL